MKKFKDIKKALKYAARLDDLNKRVTYSHMHRELRDTFNEVVSMTVFYKWIQGTVKASVTDAQIEYIWSYLEYKEIVVRILSDGMPTVEGGRK